ncbi:hypothetical protein F938_00822 [Acinetobacter bereziniae LMG 1003 = CIP 70.12]|uniref:Phage replication protein n=1 Tax=Acinetobacter bereziniae LMG 1003 = CIP 70.12 TaxID=981324 RepID=N9DPK2_ACIBZ|nr:hypothetical protein [Acinetobacter bereziniae]ENW00178.1 hypothetical protein F938_00822 [Acinetobacter bereziniae LMG 1003 = CIP 70.12]
MARARNIKPSFFTNDELSELDPLARLLFIGMWTVADHKGCFEYKPKRLKVQLLPYDECNIEELTINLEKSGFIAIYSVQGQQYIKVINFEKHQNPHKNEREKGSELPDIDQKDEENPKFTKDLGNIEINHDENGSDRADSLNLIPDSLLLKPENLLPESETKTASPKFNFKTELKKLGVSDELATEFLQVRKAKQAVNTKNAFESLVTEIGKTKLTMVQAIEYCLKRQKPWGAFKASWYQNEQIPQQPHFQTTAQQTANEHDRWREAEQQVFGGSEIDITPKKQDLIEGARYV